MSCGSRELCTCHEGGLRSCCEDHPTCKRVRDCERGMRPNVEASTRRDRAERERVLFIGTQFSILYTSMYSQAEAATR